MPSTLEKRLANLLEPAIEGLGFNLVRLCITGTGRPAIQVMAERPDRTITVDDCARLSRELSAILEVEDPMAGGYVLEVSSPGIDRPLTRLKDFRDFAGFEAKLETKTLVEGQRRFRGKLAGEEKGKIRILTKDGEKEVEFENIEKAKLILTDELATASLKGQAT